MNRMPLRGDIARLLSEARKKAAQLAAATGDGVLLYFIQMAILEVLAQQADEMEERGELLADSGFPSGAAASR